MAQIFISYRRADSAKMSRRLYDALVARVGKKNVFRDVDTLMKGHDFRAGIEKYVIDSDVMLVLIGDKWLNIADEETGEHRLDNPEDFVRIEVDMGLRHTQIVLPVLINGASMPTETELPLRLSNLAFKNAIQLRDSHFDEDFAELLTTLGIRPNPYPLAQIAGGILAIVIIIAAIFGGMNLFSGADASETPPTPTILKNTATDTNTPTDIATSTPTATHTSIPLMRQIVFSRSDGEQSDIFLYDFSTGQTQLTNNVGNDEAPAWSPDGKQIAFASSRFGDYEIYIMNADGSSQRRLTVDLADDEAPAWSPDSSQIAFASNQDGDYEIHVMDADGSNQRRLTSNEMRDYAPAWSSDGSQIAFASSRFGDYEIYVMDADGSNQRRLTVNPADDEVPVWSPDGSQIAFASNQDGDYEIYVMDTDGSNQRRLTSNEMRDYAPAWSSDGSQIAFISNRDGNFEIYVMDADGSNVRRITETLENESDPQWRPVVP